MTNLLDLPTEIVEQIVDFTIPNGISKFTESCQAIHDIGERFISADQRFRCYRSYGAIYISNVTDEDEGVFNPLDLFQDILRAPRLARYPKTLTLGQWDNPRRTIDDVYPEGHEIDVADVALEGKIVKEVRGCSYIPDNEKDLWIGEIKRGNVDTITAFLLTLLPNIQEIILLEGFHVGQFLRDMVDWMAQDPQKLIQSGTLSKLTTVNARPRFNTNTNGKQETKFLALFSGLPSVKTLNYNDIETTSPMNKWDPLTRHTGVTDINIEGELSSDLIASLI